MEHRYSALRLFREGLRGQRGWTPAWRSPEPRRRYDAVIIGGGGHGLSAAWHLAKDHGITDVLVIEKAWLGGGNTGRNTTIIRSNYFHRESQVIYDASLKIYEGLSRELNYNIMFSQRGNIELAHAPSEMEGMRRVVNAMQVAGIESSLLTRDDVLAMVPLLDPSPYCRWPVFGGMIQRRAGVARHDAVAWGYARAADGMGVDIVQNCAVNGFRIEGGRVRAVETSHGVIEASVFGMAVAGASPELARLAGFRLPLLCMTLQAMVSEPLKPCLHHVVASTPNSAYVSQSDKGELVIGGGLEPVPSYARRGDLAKTREVLASVVEMFPAFSTLRLMRQWGGTVDTSPDNSPILGPSPLTNLYLNCGWGTGGFKAIPIGGKMLAHLMATGRHHDLSAPFGLERFATGRLIDEAHAGVAHD
ncbi:MAG: sarcosine oxidase subunit beta family protein [Alphaproteobacteria bacterium]|nr:sarcosine oxidase subunit beta family protein [Alphaproteobacteria bacterium]